MNIKDTARRVARPREFRVAYRMVCNGTVRVTARNAKEAETIAERMDLSKLAREAADGETEIVSVEPV